MTTETKTEARERMDNEEFELRAKATVSQLIPPVAWLVEEASRARASEASLTAALSALRAEHQRVRAREAETMEAVRRLLVGRPDHASDCLCPWCGLRWAAEKALADAKANPLPISPAVSPKEHQRVVASLEEAERVRDTHWESGERYRKETLSLRSELAEVTKERDEALAANEGLLDDAGEKMLHRTIRELRAALAASEEKAREMREALKHARKAVDVADLQTLRIVDAALSQSPGEATR